MSRPSTIAVVLLQLLARPALADEPGVATVSGDEPAMALERRFAATPEELTLSGRVELGFGLASPLVDPDVGEGYGGGLYLSAELFSRIGLEISLFAGANPYEGQLGDLGTLFLAGNVGLGPTVRLTPLSSRWFVSLDTAVGAYLIVPFFQENVWTLGVAGGVTVSWRLVSWFGLSVKLRYHLFNLANIAGPELRDLKALMKVGPIDRLEIPLCLSFFF